MEDNIRKWTKKKNLQICGDMANCQARHREQKLVTLDEQQRFTPKEVESVDNNKKNMPLIHVGNTADI